MILDIEPQKRELICEHNVFITCSDDGHVASEQDCGDETCVPAEGCVLCLEGQFSCSGNTVRSCNPGPPLSWDDVE